MKLEEINRKEFYTKWTAALRSRQYKRATGTLVGEADAHPDQTGHCCLGVACDILSKEYGYGQWKNGHFQVGNSSVCGIPQDRIINWLFAGMKHGDTNRASEIAGHLAESNDSGRAFNKTAIVIDRLAKQIA